MTLQELFDLIALHPEFVLAYMVIVPAVAYLIGQVKDKNLYNWRYAYSALVYLTCVPGIFSLVICAYSFLFERQSFLQVNAIVYFLPIASMIATLLIMRKQINLSKVPGFGKLSGLLMMIGVTFTVMLFIEKMRISLWFHGSMGQLGIFFVILLAVFMFGWSRLFAGEKE